MGAGKTTIGHRLSRELRIPFYDSDEVIESRNGVAISTIFDIEGEQGFRIREAEIIDELTQMRGIVLSTGGGAIINEKSRAYLKDRGFVVYLKASIEQMLERTAKDKKRPLLQSKDPKSKLIQIQKEREPLYQETADLIINTNHKSAKQVAEQIYNYKVKV